jgi:glycosyltransferase involved in cell wall biosynthesis
VPGSDGRAAAPLLSIIVPVLGGSTQIPQLRCATTVTKTDTSIELIVVVDGEPGATVSSWLNETGDDPSVVVIESGEHDPGLARNRGLEVATGEYLGFLDSDDLARLPLYLDLARGMSVSRDSIGVIGFQSFDEGKRSEIVEQWCPPTGVHCAWADIELRAAVWRFVFHRETLQRLGVTFPPGAYGEDLIFLAGVFTELPEAVGLAAIGYTYRLHSSSQLTARRPSADVVAQVLARIVDLFARNSTWASRRVLASWYARIALLHYGTIRKEVELDHRLLAVGLVSAAMHPWRRFLARVSRGMGSPE